MGAVPARALALVHGAHLLWQAQVDRNGQRLARHSFQNGMTKNITELKRRLRGETTRQRAAVVGREAKALALRDHLLKSDLLQPDVCIAGYWPISSEIDIRPLLQALHLRGQRLAMPAVERAEAPLVFRAWQPGETMRAGAFGTFEPYPDAVRQTPSILLVPQLAFDRRGYRLGYGGGFYDRSIPVLRRQNPDFLTIGIAFSAQEISAVPLEPTDVRLDYIATENGIIHPDLTA